MTFDANLETIVARLDAPPGHQREAMPDQTSGHPFQVEIDTSIAGARDYAHRERLAGAANLALGRDAAGKSVAAGTRRTVAHHESAPKPVTERAGTFARHPVSTVGRVTAWFDGSVRFCTGTVIAERIVLTAAHCTYARGTPLGGGARFADWVTFEPGFENGRSAGDWVGEAVYIQRGWSDPVGDTPVGPFDYAIVRLDAPIAHMTGTASVLINADPPGPFTAFGYPRVPNARFDFDGEYLFSSRGERIASGEEGTLYARNELTEGASGGPWFTESDGTIVLVGLNSTKPLKGDDTTWSPRLGKGFEQLLARALADMTGV